MSTPVTDTTHHTAVTLAALDDLHPWQNNPRQGDIDAIADSLATYGQYRPAVVQHSGRRICIGNNMFHAARKLGWTNLAVVELELDDEQAARLLARDNKIADNASYDTALLADLLKPLADTDTGLDGTGYDDTDLTDLLRDTGAAADFLTPFLHATDEPASSDGPGGPGGVSYGGAPAAFSHGPATPPSGAGTVAPSPTTGGGPLPPPTTTDNAADAAPASAEQNRGAPGAGPLPADDGGAATVAMPGPQPAPPEPLATVTWTVTVADRQVIRDAIKHAQHVEPDVDGQAAALVAICRHYLDVHTAPDHGQDDAS